MSVMLLACACGCERPLAHAHTAFWGIGVCKRLLARGGVCPQLCPRVCGCGNILACAGWCLRLLAGIGMGARVYNRVRGCMHALACASGCMRAFGGLLHGCAAVYWHGALACAGGCIRLLAGVGVSARPCARVCGCMRASAHAGGCMRLLAGVSVGARLCTCIWGCARALVCVLGFLGVCGFLAHINLDARLYC